MPECACGCGKGIGPKTKVILHSFAVNQQKPRREYYLPECWLREWGTFESLESKKEIVNKAKTMSEWKRTLQLEG